VANLDDVSRFGACLLLDLPIPAKTPLRIVHGSGELAGKVVYSGWQELGYFIGIEFDPVAGGHQQTICLSIFLILVYLSKGSSGTHQRAGGRFEFEVSLPHTPDTFYLIGVCRSSMEITLPVRAPSSFAVMTEVEYMWNGKYFVPLPTMRRVFAEANSSLKSWRMRPLIPMPKKVRSSPKVRQIGSGLLQLPQPSFFATENGDWQSHGCQPMWPGSHGLEIAAFPKLIRPRSA
jgi:hypothetical protein